MLKKIVLIVLILIVAVIGGGMFYVRQNPLKLATAAERKTLEKEQFTRKTIAGPQGTIVYWEKGTGPTVIMVHGAGDQAGTWSKIAPGLAGDHRVLLVDLPGHGESQPKTGPIRIGDEVNGLDALVKAAGDGKVTLIGNSMGVWVSMLYGMQHAEQVERIVALNGGPYRINLTYNLMPEDREDARKVMAALQDPSRPKIPDFVLDDIVRRTHSGPMSRLKQVNQEEFALDGKLGGLNIPVDVIWGEADRMMGPDYGKRLVSEIPASRLTPLEHCGHIPQRECPAALATHLKQILQSTPPAAVKPAVKAAS